jgi:uncharacterized membrane protein YtjA (UPF0391 family)
MLKSSAAGIAEILFYLFIALAIVSFLLSLMRKASSRLFDLIT